jgi:hypothetical protein
VTTLARQTLYEVLEVSPAAPSEEVAKACDRAMAIYGPGSLATYTLMSPEDAAYLVGRIEEARQVLLDAAARARYDAAIGIAPAAATPAPPVETPAAEEAPPRADVLAAVAVLPAAAPPPDAAPPVSPIALLPAPTPSPAGPPPAAAPAPAAATSAGRGSPIPLRNEIAPTERDVVVPEGTSWTGDVLRKVREARGISIDQIAVRTRVVRHHVENIEADRFGMLPAPVYLRGILVALARELRLDGQKVARSYLERVQGAAPAPPPPPRSR